MGPASARARAEAFGCAPPTWLTACAADAITAATAFGWVRKTTWLLFTSVVQRLPRAMHLRGDVFRKMIVNGREEISASASEAALAQLSMRHRMACNAAYAEAGFDMVY